MIEIATQAVENMAKIKTLSEEIHSMREATDKEVSRLNWDVYRPRIRVVEEERDLKVKWVTQQGEAAQLEKNAEIVALNKVVRQVRLILDFLRLDSHRNLDISDEDIQFSRYHSNDYKESLGLYIDDTYLKAKLYIIGNEKPTNKYSLVVLGKCLFYEDLLKLERNYGASFHTSDRYELEKVVRDFPSVEQAKAWLDKNRGKLISGESRVQYQEVKIAYNEAIQTYKADDFQEFLLARCQCGNFYTIWEDYIKRNTPVSCPKCDQQMALAPGK